ncbi:MAG: hypothetical protein KDA87_17695, partial [Planctomycetales bacterium]|nr:hypothetical protein [Planctomycetales bacterium]
MSRALLRLAFWMTFAVITLHDTVVVDSTRTGNLFAQENNEAAEVDSAQALHESDSQNRLGRIIRIRTPITGSDDIRIKRAIEQLLDNLPRNVATENRPVLVLEFVPPLGGDGSGSEFERCLA